MAPPAALTRRALNRATLARQGLLEPIRAATVAAAVERVGSLQAQHPEPKHRDRVIADAHRPAVFSKSADVLPTFLIDGFVAGTWDLARRNGTAAITLRPFAELTSDDRRALEAEAYRVLVLLTPAGVDRSVHIGP